MAHHGHFEQNVETEALRTMQSRPVSLALPSISEDELAAEVDEPPDHSKQIFTKALPSNRARSASLLTKALHTDTESQDDDIAQMHMLGRDASRSSTCSSTSMMSSNGMSSNGFGSDGGRTSSTRASTPNSPPPSVNLLHIKPTMHQSPPRSLLKVSENTTPSNRTPKPASPTSPTSTSASEPNVEAQLGRKRCITFACGRKQTPAVEAPPKIAIPEPAAIPTKRPCMLKFVCPMSKTTTEKPDKAHAPKISRHLSPAPPTVRSKSPTPKTNERSHRDSDSTIKNISPRATRKAMASVHTRHLSNDSTTGAGEALRFHEFATSEEDVADWVQESTCHRSRLTVNDTLKKENVIRETCQEAEEEALEEEEAEQDARLEDDEDEVSDDGFQTDDEDGFAESDGDSDGDSDYEWWTMRKSPHPTSLVPNVDTVRPTRRTSWTSMNSSSPGGSLSVSPSSPKSKPTKSTKISGPVIIRPGTPELPDSTDFVCGTLDEDRPLEQAYLSCLAQRKAAKQKSIPQDIDPSFPTSDPEMGSDEEDDFEVTDSVQESDQHLFLHGRIENLDGNLRGRRPSKDVRNTTPITSPKRYRSPAPALIRRPTYPHSPAPRALFGHSPVREQSPMPFERLHSPRPSLSGSPVASPRSGTLKQKHPFLGQRPQLTHTASLPRSPCPFARRSRQMNGTGHRRSKVSDEEGDATPQETAYSRGAIDIVQGLECKRLRRRQRFYERYCRKEEKKMHKKDKRPPPGKGAQRMRQIGMECAEYRGKRVLSI